MTCITVGELVDQKGRSLFIKDVLNSQIYEFHAADDKTLDLEIGVKGIWVGEEYKGTITVSYVEIRKLLDPLYEEDVLTKSGCVQVQILNDPFNKIFEMKKKEWLENNETI